MYTRVNIMLERNLGPVRTESYSKRKRRGPAITDVFDEDEMGEIWRSIAVDSYKPIIEEAWENPMALPLLGVSRMATTILVLLTEEVSVTNPITGCEERVAQDNFRILNCEDTVTELTTNYKDSKRKATVVNDGILILCILDQCYDPITLKRKKGTVGGPWIISPTLPRTIRGGDRRPRRNPRAEGRRRNDSDSGENRKPEVNYMD